MDNSKFAEMIVGGRLRQHADRIVEKSIAAVLPDSAVERALEGADFPGRVILVAVGKAAWRMAHAAHGKLGSRISGGIVITKYGHSLGPIGNLEMREAGHPVPDENSYRATLEALELVNGLKEQDTVLFLLSGGGSALFELPLIPAEELQEITGQLLASGAGIVEINTIRKRLSAVKGGRFGRFCAPGKIFSVVLSDIVGDPLDMIASGPAVPDSSTCQAAWKIVQKFDLKLSEKVENCLNLETPKKLDNVTTRVTGSVGGLCAAAAEAARELGYEPHILTEELVCEAKDAGKMLAETASAHYGQGKMLAFIAGGETAVKVLGTGKGGRNQELALSAAAGIEGMEGVCIFSIGSDGTDGPTDAAGGYADGTTAEKLRRQGMEIDAVLKNNDAYHALRSCGGLIITGPTGTNVNDVAVLLMTPVQQDEN